MKKLSTILFLLLVTNAFSQPVPVYVPTNGLEGWWPFNGNANDESGLGHNGTVSGALLATDRFGNLNTAYQFDGVNDSINLALQQNNISSYSVSGWFKTTFGGAILAGRNVNGQVGVSLHIHNTITEAVNAGKAIFIADGPNVALGSLTGNTYHDNQWHHIVGVYNGISGAISSSQFSIYVDGVLVAQSTYGSGSATAPINNLTNILIGAHQVWNGGVFNGIIDDIGVWNRALTVQEIIALYQSCTLAINMQPTDQASNTSSSVQFTVTSNDPNATYQWQTDFGLGYQDLADIGQYSGSTTSTLIVNNAQLKNHTQTFQVIASGGSCYDTSTVATLFITDTCIVIDTNYISVTDTLIIDATLTGIPAPNNINTIKIYPNPAATHIFIDNGTYASMVGYTIRIENALGQTVFQNAINQQQFLVDLSTWTGNGTYFVYILDNLSNTIEVRKVIVQ